MEETPMEAVAWIGLPHQIGADPREGKGACCLRIASIINEQAGRPFPHEEVPGWIELALREDWAPIRQAFYERTSPLQLREPRAGDLHLFERPDTGALGLGTVIHPLWMVLPFEDGGLRIGPRRLWQAWPLRRVIP